MKKLKTKMRSVKRRIRRTGHFDVRSLQTKPKIYNHRLHCNNRPFESLFFFLKYKNWRNNTVFKGPDNDGDSSAGNWSLADDCWFSGKFQSESIGFIRPTSRRARWTVASMGQHFILFISSFSKVWVNWIIYLKFA